MRVMQVVGDGEGARLVEEQCPVPELQTNEVLIKVECAGVNRPDLLQKRGLYPAPPGSSPHLGLEVSGTVAAIGGDAAEMLLRRQSARVGLLKAWKAQLDGSAVQPSTESPVTVGSSVASLTNGGGYAEYVAVPAGQVMAAGEEAHSSQWGCVPEAAMTAWHNVFERGCLAPGSVFLCHGATGSVGGMAARMARAAGAVVVATARDGEDERAAHCRAQGADWVMPYAGEQFFGNQMRTQGTMEAIASLSVDRMADPAHPLLNPVAGVGLGVGSSPPASGLAAIAQAAFDSKLPTGSHLRTVAGMDTLGQAHAQLLSGQAVGWRAPAGGGAVDVVLDMVGAPLLPAHLQCMGTEGRIVQIGYQAGSRVTAKSVGDRGVDLMRVMLKRLHLTGSTLRSRSDEAKSRIAAAVEALVVPSLLATGGLPPVAASFPLGDAEAAHAWLEEPATCGKAVLTV